jgi:hypothetical protein
VEEKEEEDMGQVVIFIYARDCILPAGIKYLAAIDNHATV